MAGHNQKLFSFAYFPKHDENIRELAENMADREDWDFSGTREKKHPILKSYLEFTFRRLEQEKKIRYSSCNEFACFNTGLVTRNLEDIYVFFSRYKNRGKNSSPYFFKGFLKESDFQLLTHFSENLPEVANYFEHPEMLIYNPKLKLIVNIDHIISDNLNRFPLHLQVADQGELRRQLHGAIDEIRKKVRTNYKLAVPQFYNGQVQLLLPLNLTSGSENPDLALVVQKLNATTYTARTCLTLRMAYNNARLIVRPQSNWLKP